MHISSNTVALHTSGLACRDGWSAEQIQTYDSDYGVSPSTLPQRTPSLATRLLAALVTSLVECRPN